MNPKEAPSNPTQRTPEIRDWALLAGWALVLSLLIRWPLSVNLGAMPLDPNSPLHILALDQIAGGGDWTEISNLAFPTPVPIRMVAIPTLLLGIPLAQILTPMAALNVATTLMVALQGLAVAWLVGLLRWGKTAQFIATTAAICCPLTIHVQSLGQQENLGFMAMALAVAGGCLSGRKAWVAAIFALLLAGFSSPYQAVPTGLLLMSVSYFHGKKALIRGALCSGVVALPVLLYYTGATDGASSIPGITTSPPEEGYLASAGILDMLHPRAMWDGQPSSINSISERFQMLSNGIPTAAFHPGWPWITAHQSAYIGLVLLVGALGLYRGRSSPLLRGIILGSTLSMVFAFGPSLRLMSETNTGIPMPWMIFSNIPGLADLQATHRFLSGLVFGLVLGLAFWMRSASRGKTAAVVLLLLGESLLRAPVHWPLPAARGQLNTVESSLPNGPVMLWPPLTHFAPQYYEMMAVILDRPVGIYTPNGVALAGDIEYRGNLRGHLRMDIVRKTGNRDMPIEVVHATTLPEIGSFRVDVEVDLGKVDIIVFIDKEGNGPDAYEPLETLEDIRVGFQDVTGLKFNLIDPEITQEEVEQGRDEPLRPGTHLPEDLPQKEGNLSASEWLLRGAQGGAASVLRTRSNLAETDPQEDLGFEIGSHSLQVEAEDCVTEQHCIQRLSLPGHKKRMPRR